MLYPQSNKFRSTTSLNGIWNYKTVDDDYKPVAKATGASPMAVPASINDIVTDKKIAEYVGKVLFETDFALPRENGKVYRLRIGAASHKCEVYLNGDKIGEGICGQLPIDLPLDGLKDENRLSVIVDNRLDYHTLPMGKLIDGNILCESNSRGRKYFEFDGDFPAKKQVINHDFYNFTGIHRDVTVYGISPGAIRDITVKTVVGGDYGKVAVQTEFFEDLPEAAAVKFVIRRNDSVVAWKIVNASEAKEVVFDIADPELWDIGKPELYTVSVETDHDFYETAFGIRKVSYDEKGLYINDRPVYLKGFGMHEDFFVLGKGASSAVNVKSFELLKWINANCFRTSHYPYAEEIMDLADEYGMLVVDEVPAVGCNNWPDYTYGKDRLDDVTLALHKNSLRLMLERDKNHPCMAMVSVANEAATYEDASREYFSEVIGYVRSLTDLPVTTAELTRSCEGNKIGDLVDFIGLNRYFGWYDEIGNIKAAEPLLRRDLEAYYKQFGKPIIMFEFGAEGIEGLHSAPALAFSEEYQTEFLKEYNRVFDELPYVQGELVWNFADFMTKQGTIRVNGNRKGVFTRERQPKSAAFYLKERWKNKNEK